MADTGPSVELSTAGVGPWAGEWPEGAHWDPELLEHGDSRNVVDGYRYWRMDAIVADLDTRRHPLRPPAGIPSTSPSRTGSTISTSAPSCAPRTRSSRVPCTSSVGAAGIG